MVDMKTHPFNFNKGVSEPTPGPTIGGGGTYRIGSLLQRKTTLIV
jgi:hypothetical protein